MKNLITTLLIFSLLPCSLLSQQSWAEIDTEWTYKFQDLGSFPSPFRLISTGKYFLGDTLVHQLTPESDAGAGSNTDKVIEIFEGENGEKVYYSVEGEWSILYDFTLDVGDTLKVLIAPEIRRNNVVDSFAYFRVDTVGTIELSGYTIKTQYVSCIFLGQSDAALTFERWRYQYLGQISWYFTPFKLIGCDGGCPYELRCYTDKIIGDITFTMAGDLSDRPCDSLPLFTVSNTPYPDLSPSLTLFPNPTAAGTIVQLRWNLVTRMTNARLEVKDARGRAFDVPYQEVDDGYDLTTTTLPPGLYFLELSAREGRAVKRVVIR